MKAKGHPLGMGSRMSEPRIEPPKITKPMQLLAAWLVGLVLVDGSFLGAAATLTEPSWATGALVIASIVNVPLFLFCIFLLQTRYRPEMQEDMYYSKYLDAQTRTIPSAASQDVTALRAEIFESNSRSLEIMESVQNRLTVLIDSAKASPQITSRDAMEMDKLIEETERASESIASAKQHVQWERYRIEINDLLPAYSHIRQALAEASIPVSGTFGTSSNHPKVPEVGILGFGRDVELEAIKKLVNLLKKHGIEYVSYSGFSVHSAHIFIGSYIYSFGNEAYTPIDGEVAAALTDPKATTESFVKLVRLRAPEYGWTRHEVPD